MTTLDELNTKARQLYQHLEQEAKKEDFKPESMLDELKEFEIQVLQVTLKVAESILKDGNSLSKLEEFAEEIKGLINGLKRQNQGQSDIAKLKEIQDWFENTVDVLADTNQGGRPGQGIPRWPR